MMKTAVIVAVHNGSAYLHDQLESILAQTVALDEIIVSDDASTDDSVAIANSFGVRVVRNETALGVVGNVEAALRECDADVIFLADQDDVWVKNKVEKMLAVFEERPEVNLVVSDLAIVNGDLVETDSSFFAVRHAKFGALNTVLKNSYVGAAMALRRPLLDVALPFPAGLPMHDQWLGLMSEKQHSAYVLREPLVLWRRHDSNETDVKKGGSLAQKIKWRLVLIKALL
ncbi:MAG: glycosyltransferase family 2 protein [Lactobacillales bacterium]|jgi:glycosyltransferase involved in cell wall biosynthesis|nr:glycosyltransferase family 2 protein [Lactobacillales bacterium]